MALEIPSRYEPKIEQIAQAQQITRGEAIDRILDAGLERLTTQDAHPRRSYASFFGVGKGRPGAHGSPEAADKYIQELRNEW
jgi:hypothetical protein